MLNRIVALLLSLADLAERAGGRSAGVRTLILLFLRPAEAAARRYVMDFYQDTDIAPLLHIEDNDGSTAAIRLALSFRMLAMALASLPDRAFEDDDLQAVDQWLHLAADRISNITNALCRFETSARPEVRAGLASGVW